MRMSQKAQKQPSINSFFSPTSDKEDKAKEVKKRKSKNVEAVENYDPNSPKKVRLEVAAPEDQRMASNKASAEMLKQLTRFPSALHADMGATWFDALWSEFDKPYFSKLDTFLATERASKTIFPPREDVWTWTTNFPLSETRVVILGQGRTEFY
jgi:uracil-DNA glycosylase